MAGGQILLSPGQTHTVIAYNLPNDTVNSGDRLYTLQITKATGANPPKANIIGRVRDDDPALPVLNASIIQGRIQIRLTGQAGFTYTLQRRPRLDAPDAWTNVGATLNGTGGEIVLEDTSAAQGQSYYRVAVKPR